MMCNACRKLSKVWDYGQRLLVSRFDDAKTGEPTFILTQEKKEGVAQSVVIKVRFCPWCGAALDGEEQGE